MIASTSLPIYAFIAHAVTLIMFFGLATGKKIRFIFFFIASFVAVYIISFLLLDDYANYAYIFDELDLNKPVNQIFSLYGEPLFLFVNYLFKFVTDDFNLVRFFWVFVALLIKLIFLIRWGKFYTLSFIFYVAIIFYPDSYLLRSSIASSIVFIGISNMLSNKKFYKFFIPIIIASGFHISALIAIPIWFFKNINLSKESSLIALSIIYLSGFVGFGHLVVQVIGSIFSTDTYYIERLIEYSDSIYGGSVGMLRGSSLVYLSVAIFYIVYKDHISKHTPHYHIFLNIMLYSFIFLFSFNDFEVISERLFRILAFVLVIPMGYIAFSIKRDLQTYFVIIIILILNMLAYIVSPPNLMLLT